MLVVDASVIGPAVADAGPAGNACLGRIAAEWIAAPDLLRVEVLSMIRRQLANGKLTDNQADNAVVDLLALPLQTFPTAGLMSRAWTLRDNVTPYDACYVALAEALDCTLLTTDARLARAPGVRCQIELVRVT